MLFLALQSIADGFIVGRLISATALAAVNIAVPAYTLVTAVTLIIGVGTQAQANLHLGQGNHHLAKTALRSGMIGLAAFSLTATLAINLFADGIAGMLGADEELLPLSKDYIHGLMPWLVGVSFQFFFDFLLKTLGHPRLAMAVMIGTILLNIASSLAFILLLDLGTFGAGLGSGISFTAGALVSGSIILYQLRRTPWMAKNRGHFSLRTLGHIFYNGSSEGLAEIAMGITIFLFNITLMKYIGKEGVAAYTLINYLMFVGVSGIIGISNGVIPIVSYNFGAARMYRVRTIVRLALKNNLLCGLILILLLWLCGEPIISLFIAPSETHLIGLTVRGARITSLAFLFNGLNIFATSYCTAINRAGLSLLFASLRGLVFLCLGILILPLLFGIDGIWLTFPLADLLTTLAVLAAALKNDIRQNPSAHLPLRNSVGEQPHIRRKKRHI